MSWEEQLVRLQDEVAGLEEKVKALQDNLLKTRAVLIAERDDHSAFVGFVVAKLSDLTGESETEIERQLRETVAAFNRKQNNGPDLWIGLN